jgi:hypothetical protein
VHSGQGRDWSQPRHAGPTVSARRVGPRLSLEVQAGGGGDRRRWSSVNGGDDLAAVDALQVDAGDPEVRMPELALDHDLRHTLVRHLDRVRMPELVRREPTADPGCKGCVV